MSCRRYSYSSLIPGASRPFLSSRDALRRVLLRWNGGMLFRWRGGTSFKAGKVWHTNSQRLQGVVCQSLPLNIWKAMKRGTRFKQIWRRNLHVLCSTDVYRILKVIPILIYPKVFTPLAIPFDCSACRETLGCSSTSTPRQLWFPGNACWNYFN